MVKVSILMPAYNVEKYIRECIESVMKQTLKDIEVICVDDGSTDNTGYILDEYAEQDERIRIIHKANSGYGHSMNTALKAATGEYIGIVETDDFASADMFEALYEYAKKNDLDVAKANYYKYSSKNGGNSQYFEVLKPYSLYNKVFKPSEIQNRDIFKVRPCIWSGIYRREMLINNDIWFSETPGASYQDTGFAFKVWACAERAGLLKDAYLHYRTDNDVSSVKSGAKVFCVCDEYNSIESFIGKRDDLNKELLPLVQALKLRTYSWNLNRLEFGFKYSFLLEMNKEFKSAKEKGLLKRELFSDEEWVQLNNIISKVDDYYKVIKKSALRGNEDIEGLIKEYENKVKRIRESNTYKAGKIIMLVPKKIKRLFKG